MNPRLNKGQWVEIIEGEFIPDEFVNKTGTVTDIKKPGDIWFSILRLPGAWKHEPYLANVLFDDGEKRWLPGYALTMINKPLSV